MKASEFFRKLQFVLMLALGMIPVGVCVPVYIRPEVVTWFWYLPAVYFAVCLISFALPSKLRIWLGVLGAVVMVAPWFMLENVNSRNIAVVIAALDAALLLWSMGIPGWEGGKELSVTWLGTCLMLLLVGCLLTTYEPMLMHLANWLRVALLVFVCFAMLSLNRGSLHMASGGERGFSKAMRQKNVLLTLGMFGIAFLIALIPSLANLVVWLVGLVGTLIQKLVALFPKTEVV
ncbi:MAG: hypothetical protein J6Q54_08160, partial [Oscillospiraceae bacterium]|nr:hypothetical protein [Oscillospiraceae bacterium]